jgi:hypothetical protein
MSETALNVSFYLYPKTGFSWDVLNDFESGSFEIPFKAIVQQKLKSILPSDENRHYYSNTDTAKLQILEQEIFEIQKSLIPKLKKAKDVWEQDFEWEGEWYVKTKNESAWLFDCMNMLKTMVHYAFNHDVEIEIRVKNNDSF